MKCENASMPAHDCGRLHDHDPPTPSLPDAGEQDPAAPRPDSGRTFRNRRQSQRAGNSGDGAGRPILKTNALNPATPEKMSVCSASAPTIGYEKLSAAGLR